MSFPLFLLLPKFAFSFSPFTADRTTSSTISECLCSAVVIGYFGHRCPYLFSLFQAMFHTAYWSKGWFSLLRVLGFGFFLDKHFLFQFSTKMTWIFLCISTFSAACWLPTWLAILQPKVSYFYRNVICEVGMESSPEFKVYAGEQVPMVAFSFLFLPKTTTRSVPAVLFFPPSLCSSTMRLLWAKNFW